eukprot:g3936.t1
MENRKDHAAVRVKEEVELRSEHGSSAENDDDDDDMDTFERAVGSKRSDKKGAQRKYRRRGGVSGGVIHRDNQNETEEMMQRIKGRIEGASRNCTYDLESLYSSLTRSREWSAFYEEDFVYISSKRYQKVDTIPLHDPMVGTPVKLLLNPSKDVNSFTKKFTDESKQPLGSNVSIKLQKKLVARKHIFVFQFGAIVTWGGAAGTAKKVYTLLRPYESSVQMMGPRSSSVRETGALRSNSSSP